MSYFDTETRGEGVAFELHAVPSTLCIPLAGRALGDRIFPSMAVHDQYAAATLHALGDDGSRWVADRYSVWGVLARTRFVREQAQQFMQQHPKAHFVNIGCGLSQYFQWLDNGQTRMTDADLPEVVALREQLLPPLNARQRTVALDLTDDDWWQRLHLPQRKGQPLFLIMEGVSMYLGREQVMAILRTVGANAPPGSVMVLDALSWLAMGDARWHPSLRKTGAHLTWGLKRQGEFGEAHPNLRVAQVCDVMSGYDWANAMCCVGFTMMTGVPFYALYVLQVQ